MTARPPLLCLLPLTLALSACGGSSNEDPPLEASDRPPPSETPPAAGNPAAPEPVPGPQADTNPFQVPDPDAATVLERRGYRNAVEQADRLVSSAYLEDYRQIAEQLPLLAEGIELGIEPVNVTCPLGGDAALSRPDGAVDGTEDALRYSFTACALDSVTLDGQLEQQLTTGGSRFNTEQRLDSRFDALTMSLPDGTRIQLDGTAADAETDTVLTTCRPLVPAVVLSREVDLSAVSIDSPTHGTTRLADVVYRADDEGTFEDRATCDRERRVSFTGSATATLASEPGGDVGVQLSKSGVLLRDDDDNPPVGGQATLIATADDGSSLNVTATDDAAALAQFDLRAGGAVVSFVDTYTFEP